MMTCDSAFSNQRDDANNLFYAESSNNVADIQVIHEIGMFYFEQGPMGHYMDPLQKNKWQIHFFSRKVKLMCGLVQSFDRKVLIYLGLTQKNQ